MKYTKPMDIWQLSTEQIKALPRGQWVYAGEPDNRGQFMGVKRSGSVVVMWYGNAKGKDYHAYRRAHLDYAKAWA